MLPTNVSRTVIDQTEEAMAFVQKNLHVRFEITGAPARQEIWDYPLVALREALINAIYRRDYGDAADIQVKIFENSLHIWSPGALPFDVSVADLLNPVHASRPRNKLVAQVFFDLGLIERYGGSIQRILAACESAGLPPPELENFQGGFRIVFKQATAGQVTPQVEQLLLALQGERTREFLMAQLGLRDREHFRTGYLVPALEAELVEMTFPDKPTSRLQKSRLTENGRRIRPDGHRKPDRRPAPALDGGLVPAAPHRQPGADRPHPQNRHPFLFKTCVPPVALSNNSHAHSTRWVVPTPFGRSTPDGQCRPPAGGQCGQCRTHPALPAYRAPHQRRTHLVHRQK
jgi:hypothetical protein